MAGSDAAAEEEPDAGDEDGDGGVVAGGEGGEGDGGGRAEGGERVEEAARRGQGEVAAAEEDVGHEGQEEAPEVPAENVERISVITSQEVSGKGCEISTAEVGEERSLNPVILRRNALHLQMSGMAASTPPRAMSTPSTKRM